MKKVQKGEVTLGTIAVLALVAMVVGGIASISVPPKDAKEPAQVENTVENES